MNTRTLRIRYFTKPRRWQGGFVKNLSAILLLQFFLLVFSGFGGCTENKGTEQFPQKRMVAPTVHNDKCRDYEKYDRDRNLCWERCRIGERWNGSRCDSIGYSAERLEYKTATTACQQFGARLPTVEEFESVLGNCRDWEPPIPGWRKCNKCEQTEECETLLGPWFYHQGFGLWASGKEPKRVIIWTGWVTPRYSEADPDEQAMWAVCVRDTQ